MLPIVFSCATLSEPQNIVLFFSLALKDKFYLLVSHVIQNSDPLPNNGLRFLDLLFINLKLP
jgi:hypothetical protein